MQLLSITHGKDSAIISMEEWDVNLYSKLNYFGIQDSVPIPLDQWEIIQIPLRKELRREYEAGTAGDFELVQTHFMDTESWAIEIVPEDPIIAKIDSDLLDSIERVLNAFKKVEVCARALTLYKQRKTTYIRLRNALGLVVQERPMLNKVIHIERWTTEGYVEHPCGKCGKEKEYPQYPLCKKCYYSK